MFSLSGHKAREIVASLTLLTAKLPSICFIEGNMLASTQSNNVMILVNFIVCFIVFLGSVHLLWVSLGKGPSSK